MSETPDQRAIRVRDWRASEEVCRRCGYRRINVRHEPDPDHAPEGKDYYDAMRNLMHSFLPSGVDELGHSVWTR